MNKSGEWGWRYRLAGLWIWKHAVTGAWLFQVTGTQKYSMGIEVLNTELLLEARYWNGTCCLTKENYREKNLLPTNVWSLCILAHA